jgi:hypothetical protein
MKFQLAINMGRLTPDLDMTDVERHTLEMVQMARRRRVRDCVGGRAPCAGDDHRAQSIPNPDLVGGPHVLDSARR